MNEHSLTNVLQQILDRFNAGDPKAKNQLIDRAYQRLIIVARRLLNSFSAVRTEEETAGILSNGYLRLHGALDEVRPKTVQLFFGLAALQMRRVLLDAVRGAKGRGKSPRPDTGRLDGAASGGDEAASHDPSDSAFNTAREGLGTDVLEAVDQLPENQREVVDLIFFNGLTQVEAAEILGVSDATVKRYWALARIQLASLLEAYGWSE